MTPKLRSYLIVAATLLVTLIPMLYGNIVAKKGGLMDDTLLNRKDPYYLFDQQVKSFKAQGLQTGDPIAFVIPHPLDYAALPGRTTFPFVSTDDAGKKRSKKAAAAVTS
jgi:hypothetical protein